MKNLYLIPTDKPSRLFIDVDDNKLKICVPLGGEHMMNQHIYITSDKEIKANVYALINGVLCKTEIHVCKFSNLSPIFVPSESNTVFCDFIFCKNKFGF
jgi:hypothetical protein